MPSEVAKDSNRQSVAPSRRTVLSGLGVAAAAVAASRTASAATADNKAAAPQTSALWSNEYIAMKGDVKLQLYRRRAKAPVAGEAPLPVAVLVHGSSISGMPSWDLNVPGAGEYSVMNVFARLGYDVWVIDFEGYGRSSITNGNSDIKSGVADLEAASPVIAKETGAQKFHMLGESWARCVWRPLPRRIRSASIVWCSARIPIPARTRRR
jgi:pimeloyl-ACP methyl ester carboxylesterase